MVELGANYINYSSCATRLASTKSATSFSQLCDVDQDETKESLYTQSDGLALAQEEQNWIGCLSQVASTERGAGTRASGYRYRHVR